MKRLTKFVAVPIVMGLLLLATAVPAFAKGPPLPAADLGLGTAVTNVIVNGLATPGHPANFGTHNAVCSVELGNPATSLDDPNCP